MTIHYEVHPLFPKPLYKTKVDVGLSKEAIDFILHQEMYENPSNSISINKNLLESPVLQKLNESINVHLNIFLKEIIRKNKLTIIHTDCANLNLLRIQMHCFYFETMINS